MAKTKGEATLVVKLSDKATAGLKKLRLGIGTLGRGFKEMGSQAKWLAAGLVGLGAGFAKLAVEGGKLKAVEKSFASLAASQGQNMDNMLKKMQTATMGTVDNMKLMQTANQAMMLGLPIDRLDDMMKIALSASQATGESVEFMINSLVAGMGRGSKLMLDNLGIVFKLEDAYAEYAASIGKTAANLTEAEKKQAFINKAMTAGLANAKKAGPIHMTASMAFQQLVAAAKNLSRELGKTLSPIFVSLTKRVLKMYGPIQNAIKSFGVYLKVIQRLSPQAKKFILILGGVGAGVIALTAAFTALGVVLSYIASPIIIAIGAITAIGAAFGVLETNVLGLGDVLRSLGELWWELISGPAKAWINIITRIIQGDFKGALKAIPEQLGKVGDAFSKVGKNAISAGSQIKDAWNGIGEKVKAVQAEMAASKGAGGGREGGKDPSSMMPDPGAEAEKAAMNLEQLYAFEEEAAAIKEEFKLAEEEAKLIQDEIDRERIKSLDEFQKMSYAQRALMLKKFLKSNNAKAILAQSEELRNFKGSEDKKIELKKQFFAQLQKMREDDSQRQYQLLKFQKGNQQNFDNWMIGAQRSKFGALRAIGKAFAIREAVQNTYRAATGAYASLAPIPFVGPALGAAAAAAAIAWGVEQVASIAAAAEGGVVNPSNGGQIVRVAEAGKAEAIIPLDDEEAQEKMGAVGGGGVTININGPLMGDEEAARMLARTVDEQLFKMQRAGDTISI